MKKSAFRVYIDESGDEGFVFHPDGSGSSRWFVLSGVVVRRQDDIKLVHLLDEIRKRIKREPRTALHFRKLRHEQRVPFIRMIGESKLIRTISVIVSKVDIEDKEKFASEPFLLYRYISRYLLERISWYCREQTKSSEIGGTAELIFSNRSAMSYDDLRNYVRLLKEKSDPFETSIDFGVIHPDNVRAVNHDQLAGLQMADAVASSFYYAVNQNAYGEVEDKYAQLLRPTFFRHRGTALGYGIKFWPASIEKLAAENPHLAWFKELDAF